MSMPARVPLIEASFHGVPRLGARVCSRLDPATRIMARSVPVDPERTVLRAGTGTALTAPRKVSRLQLTAGGLKVICNAKGVRERKLPADCH